MDLRYRNMINKVSTYTLIYCLFLCTSAFGRQSQVSLENTQAFSIQSEAVGENYQIQVALPMGYERSQVRYKTLYVLDANVTFAMVRDIQTLISFEEGNPPMIVVGIGYAGLADWFQKRARDYMPTKVATAPGSGGGEQFLAFLEEELLPKIDQDFRTNGERVIYGHSTAALFGFYSLSQNPALFSGYVLTSPSVDEDEDYTFERFKKWSLSPATGEFKIYTSIGTEEKSSFQSAYEQLVKMMTQKSSKELAYKSEQLKGTHMSSMPQAFVSGLQFVNGVK